MVVRVVLMNKTFKALSMLLQYPEVVLFSDLPDILSILLQEEKFSFEIKEKLSALVSWMQGQELIALQEQYVDLFDRSRRLSLHLFEHVHGESRDRGQAMVDLMEHYQQAGYAMHPSELPDYLPLVLEFFSCIEFKEAQKLLRQFLTILVAIHAQLQSKNSLYLSVFDALIALTGFEVQVPAILDELDIPEELLDENWEEAPIDFSHASQCGASVPPDSRG